MTKILPKRGIAQRADRFRLLLTAGALAAATVAVTSASATDFARLNFVGESLVESPRFDIGVVRDNGTVEQADKDGGFDWAVAGATDLVPGKSVATTIPVFNNTSNLKADTNFQIVLRNGDGRVAAGVPNILPFLRFTATDEANKAIFTDVPWDQAKGALGVLGPRWGAVLKQGDQFSPAADGSLKKLNLTIKYVDGPGVENYNGGQTAIAVRFDAVSAAP
ncbi:hypothetical protein [Arthrobacter sp. AZCC_0090]|uniref:hypothetical protein n=1 Tax=Arthrobacter sp. AZCC_0090 TaxID=2735881 RepID=UPI0016206183|nr:hypothetical protein [Arthrobacter sp. AZCC_0090]MBB6403780.1 hypothetical protein [Arthrobacter sp. AZCC_0090]